MVKDMKSIIIYIHGKGGNAAQTEHYKSPFSTSDIIGFDYNSAQNLTFRKTANIGFSPTNKMKFSDDG